MAAAGFITLALVARVVYNLFFHPLRRFPGPLAHRATRLTFIYCSWRGAWHQDLRALHEQYGSVVRTAPDELSFSDEAAWKDIYGHRIGEHGQQDENEKWIVAYAGTKTAPRSMLSAPRAEHTYLRRLLSHGFSDRSLRAQEDLVRRHIDLLITKLNEVGADGTRLVNIRDWIAYTTFDIIGDLGFGADFDTLGKDDHRQWPKIFSGPTGRLALQGTLRRMILPDWLCNYINSFKGRSPQSGPFQAYVRKTVGERMAYTTERVDLVEGLIRRGTEEKAVPESTIMLTAGILLAAGFETTASLVTAVLYLLVCNPTCLEKVTKEVRSSFESREDITFASVDQLPYMVACLNEALRWYPPVASGLPRQVMKGGTTIGNRFVPEKSIVSVPHWASSHLSANFVKPDEYHPERWLEDPEFASDKLDVVQPFMVGPRNCIGRNLAIAEMRTIVALILYSFDISMPPEYQGWAEKQKFYNLWDRGPLEMRLTPSYDIEP